MFTKAEMAAYMADSDMANGAGNTRDYWFKAYMRRTKAELVAAVDTRTRPRIAPKGN